MRILNIKIVAVAALFASSLSAGAYGEVADGVRAFDEKDYQEALTKFQEANISNPESPVVLQNLGLASYRLSDFEKAREGLEKAFAAAEDPIEKGNIQYDLGNAFFQIDSLPRAIIHYQKALEFDPNNEDAKYNLELARALLKEFSDKKQQKQQQQQQGQQQQKQQQQKQDQEKKDREQQQQQQDQQKQDREKQDREKEDQQAQRQPKKGEMSKEEADRLLDAMKDKEKELQKKKMRREGGGGNRHAKPW